MKKKIKWIDIAKGLAIILMVIGHTIPYNTFNIFIFSFHMPLFVILSGITYKMPKNKDDIKNRIKKYVKQLLIPYFFTLLICTILLTLSDNTFSLVNIIKQFSKNLIWGNGCDYKLFGINFIGVSPIWFLIALFFSKLFFDIINYKINNKDISTNLIIYCFLALAGIMIGKFIWLPQNFDLVLIFLLYLYIGFIFNKYTKDIEKHKTIVFIICFIIWSACLGFNFNIELEVRSYPYGFLSIIESICASYCIIELCKIFEKNNMLQNILSKIGMISLIILCIHSIEYVIIDWTKLSISIYLIAILRVIFVLIISFAFVFIKNKIKNLKILKKRTA